MLRPSRLFAIARRDLAQNLQGRRGLVLSGVTGLLLLPAAAVPINLPDRMPDPPRTIVVGDVPDEVLALDRVQRPPGRGAVLRFTEREDGRLEVQGQIIPRRVRDALDGEHPALTLVEDTPEVPYPGRTALLALISASVLTGGISESIGGERSRKTLQALLSAAISRQELVVGKWLAWSGYAAVSAWFAAAVSILTGRAEIGWWLLPLPMVAAGTVATGLFLVRHASDVVSGAAVSLRVLPALLAITGFVAWYFSDISPLFSAALPVGGALLASGSTWPGPVTPLVATASTGLYIALLLWRTAAGLEQPAPPPESTVQRLRRASLVTAMAAMCWWLPVAAPLLWGAAGNPVLTAELPARAGVIAGGLSLVTMACLHMGRERSPLEALGLTRPPTWTWLLAPVSAVLLLLALHLPGLDGSWGPLTAAAAERLARANQPSSLGVLPFVLGAIGQQLVFRGWLQRSAGPVIAVLAAAIVLTPLDPLVGLGMAAVSTGLTVLARGSILPALAGHLLLGLLIAFGP